METFVLLFWLCSDVTDTLSAKLACLSTRLWITLSLLKASANSLSSFRCFFCKDCCLSSLMFCSLVLSSKTLRGEGERERGGRERGGGRGRERGRGEGGREGEGRGGREGEDGTVIHPWVQPKCPYDS